MDVADDACGEVKVDHNVHSFEVDSSGHQVCADEDPDLAQSELFDNLISFILLFVSVDHVGVDPFVDQFMKELLGPLLRLQEDQHWRAEPASNDLPQSHQLPIFLADVDQLLIHILVGSILHTHLHLDYVLTTEELLHGLFNARLHGGTKEKLGDLLGLGYAGQKVRNLSHETHFKHLVSLIQHHVLKPLELICFGYGGKLERSRESELLELLFVLRNQCFSEELDSGSTLAELRKHQKFLIKLDSKLSGGSNDHC